MKRLIPKTEEEVHKAIEEARETLESGGLIIYPTDTLYGIGVDATNSSAIQRVFELKGRDENKALSVIVSDMISAESYVKVNDLSRTVGAKMLPGAVTLILPKKDALPDELTGGSEDLAIRIPDSYFCIGLAKAFGKPYTTTSANAAGEDVEQNIDAILEQFSRKEDLIDLVIDVGELENRNPSTILKIGETSVEVVREGSVNPKSIPLVTRADSV